MQLLYAKQIKASRQSLHIWKKTGHFDSTFMLVLALSKFNLIPLCCKVKTIKKENYRHSATNKQDIYSSSIIHWSVQSQELQK